MDTAEAVKGYAEGLNLVPQGGVQCCSQEGIGYRPAIDEVPLRPVSPPRPRLWIGANTTTGVGRAARSADAWVIGARPSLRSVTGPAAAYLAACAQAGRPPSVAVIRDAWLGRTDAEAFEQVGHDLLTSHLERVRGGFINDPLALAVEAGSA